MNIRNFEMGDYLWDIYEDYNELLGNMYIE